MKKLEYVSEIFHYKFPRFFIRKTGLPFTSRFFLGKKIMKIETKNVFFTKVDFFSEESYFKGF
jgi:hypothetical protein